MKKSKRTTTTSKKKRVRPIQQPAQTRRDTLITLRNWGLGAAVLGGAGWFGTRAVYATMAEHDLSRIGSGLPTVVQIHDPTCPSCNRLQRAARKALRCFEKDQVQYLVANIQSDDGRRFATSHGVAHITLLLFDATGERVLTLQGVREAEELKPYFQDIARVT